MARKDERPAEQAAGQDAAENAENTDAKAERAEKRESKREKRAANRRRQASRRHAGAIWLTTLLAIASFVAILLPSWSIPAGCDLGGANVVTLAASDYEDNVDASAVLAALRNRADSLEQHDLQVSQAGDDTFELRVPAGYDASSVADALTQGGSLELVRVDSISDADVLQKLQQGASNVELEEGTYEPFVTSDEVTGAGVVSQSYYGTTYYGISVSLNSDGASSLADVTDELTADGASGQIAVLLDGVVIAEPSVSSKIEGGKINISGGFTEDQAYAYAAAVKNGPLGCSLSQSEPESVGSAFGDASVYVPWAVAVVVEVAFGLVATRAFGRAGATVFDLPVLTVVLGLGILTILARFDLVVLGRMELVGLLASELAAIACAWRLAARYRGERVAGASVRKAQQQACGPEMRHLLVVTVVVLAACIVAAVVVPGRARELSCALASGIAALLVVLVTYAPASLDINSADDVLLTAGEQLEADDDAKAGE